MTLMGAELSRVAPGEIDITLAYRPDLGQQSNALHAGTVAAVADTACGLAAQTMMDAGCDVVSVEFKINMLAPAIGERFIARGRVVRAGRTITFTSAEFVNGDGKLIATMTATMMTRRPTRAS